MFSAHYVLLGIAVALIGNCLILPVRTADVTRRLGRRYIETEALLTRAERGELSDQQLYYHALLHHNLLEQKLRENAATLSWTEIDDFLERHCSHPDIPKPTGA